MTKRGIVGLACVPCYSAHAAHLHSINLQFAPSPYACRNATKHIQQKLLGCSLALSSCAFLCRFLIENSHSTLLNNGQSSDDFAYTYTAAVNPGNLKVRLMNESLP